jgi:hypothetical protein
MQTPALIAALLVAVHRGQPPPPPPLLLLLLLHRLRLQVLDLKFFSPQTCCEKAAKSRGRVLCVLIMCYQQHLTPKRKYTFT